MRPAVRKALEGEVAEVVVFMREIGLSQYSDVLLKHGFDDLEILMDVQDSHLKAMGFLPGHMLKIKKRLKEHLEKKSSPALAEQGWMDPGTARVVYTPSTTSLAVPSGAQGFAAPPSEIIEVVSQSWPKVEGKVLEIAESLYKNLFSLAPDARKLFPLSVRNRYRDWASGLDEVEDDFEASSALPMIWSKVIHAVFSSISGLRNPSKLVLDLNALGMRHAGYNVKEEFFAFVGQALIMALRTHVEGLTCDVEHAWLTIYEFIAEATRAGFRSVQTQLKTQVRQDTLRPAPTLLRSRRSQAGLAESDLSARKMAFDRLDRHRVPSKNEGAQGAPKVSPKAVAQERPMLPQALGVVPSKKAILTVQQSWLAVKELGIANVGEILYKHLFRIAPETKKLFPLSVRMRYREWTTSVEEVEDDFENSPATRNLFAKVVEAVGTAVAGLHNISRLVFELNALGMRHINYNMQEEYFAYGGQALVLTLQDGLGKALTDEIKQAWVSVYEFISANIISGLRFAHEKANLLKKVQLDLHKEGSSWSTGTSAVSAGSQEDSFDDDAS